MGLLTTTTIEDAAAAGERATLRLSNGEMLTADSVLVCTGGLSAFGCWRVPA
ncbi:hypothetical protein [Streptomyces europaeiscabiei]|uniref:hypothetical protein n=1 Tax=Streptomyces europaeiscabiei TaxID=146819 RepID=UPI0038F7AC18